ncbi:2-phosphosulfolactate phosphatase [Paenibacillus gansuensis]|uniref:Probable 2-phosphosulfolactate phosphatase n=1 Tax=Paenibacillus gansuensis TaxID=306542 RepID=A0ABW5PAC1_9BACL
MQVHVISSVNEAVSEELLHKTVIAIDVLRATSTITAALENGSTGVLPVETVQQARTLQDRGDVLGGERYCRKIAGFHLGNSPLEYTSQEIQGRRVILTTTNGTRALHKAHKASHVLAGCLRNAAACAKAAIRLGRDTVILCAGTKDEFSLEDGLCAGLITEHILQARSGALEVNDLGLALRAAYLHSSGKLTETLLASSNGRRLLKIGYKADVVYCAEANVSNLVPILEQGTMVPFHL